MVNETTIALSSNNVGKRLPTPERMSQEAMSTATPSGLASIVVTCCGQLEYTKLCVPSLLKHTRQPFELIFLDIGSLDGTAEYLAGIVAASHLRVAVVRTPTDLGIAQAVQDALKQARGEFVVLLNNDTVVSDAWLTQLISLATMSPAIGLVGPMTNYATPPQFVQQIPYRIGPRNYQGRTASGADHLVDVSAIDDFARKWREEHRGKWLEAERLGGFCLLIKREVLKRIGHLREPSDLAFFDSDMLSARARHAGFTLACCRDLFVHHFGARIFAQGAPKVEADKANVPA
jgi:GT2 family glycosyltransferase